MFLYREEANRLLKEASENLSLDLKQKNSVINKILEGDDWSLVIKAAALTEAAVTQAIVTHIGEEKLKRMVERLPMLGDEVSKIALAKDLGLLSKEQRRFMRKLAELRNRLAHGIDQVDFNFQNHISSADAKAKKDWQDTVMWFPMDEETRHVWYRIALEKPKVGFQMALFMLIALLSIDQNNTDSLRKIEATASKTTKEFLTLEGGL